MPQEIELDALDLAAIIRPGDHIVWGQGAGEPSTLVEKLLEQRQRIGHASIFLGGVRSRRTLRPEHTDVLTFSSIGAMGNLRALANAGHLRVVPTHLSQLSGYFAQGVIRADVVFVQLSKPDESGEYSFSIANDFQQAAMAQARVVIAEVNDQAPWTYCEGRIEPARIDYIVRTSRAPVQVRGQAIGPVEAAIARHVGRYIEDGATIQIGVGAIPDAVLASVGDRRDLGIHSGLISDRVADLMEQGVVTNARKPIDTGITATGSLLGTDRLYRFAHKNRAIRLFTQKHTHRLEILSRIDKFVALNSAIEVDLTGQVNAEVAAGDYIGGVGGQGDLSGGRRWPGRPIHNRVAGDGAGRSRKPDRATARRGRGDDGTQRRGYDRDRIRRGGTAWAADRRARSPHGGDRRSAFSRTIGTCGSRNYPARG